MDANAFRAPCVARFSFQRPLVAAATSLRSTRALMLALLLSLPVGAVMAQAAAPQAAAQTRFDILEFVIEGNTRLPQAAIERAVMPFLGEQRHLDDVEAARVALEKAYQGAGYLSVFVDVPEQRVDGGLVTLQVIEGRVERLAVTGARYYSQGRIRAMVPELAEGQVPNFNVVQQQLGELNRSEDRRVLQVLSPGRLPGTLRAELKVEDKLPIGGSVELSNTNAVGTAPLRASMNLRYDNFLQKEHSLSLTAITAPEQPSQSQVLVASYTLPMSGTDSLALSWVHSNSALDSLGGTQVLGRGNTLGLRYTVQRSLTNSVHSLAAGVDYKDLSEDIRTSAGVVAKPLRYAPVQAAYNGSWFGESYQHQLSAVASYGFTPVLRTERDDCPLADGSFGRADQFACKNRGADGGFATLRLDWRGMQRLGKLELGARFALQMTSQALTGSERFTIGGAESVRGYYEGAAAGDRGWLGSVELRSPNLAVPLGAGSQAPLGDFRLYVFADAGLVNIIEPEPEQAARSFLLSAGLGMRVSLRQGLSLGIDWARPRRAPPGGSLLAERLHVRAGFRF